jgi:hypothetical protein
MKRYVIVIGNRRIVEVAPVEQATFYIKTSAPAALDGGSRRGYSEGAGFL